MSKRCSKCGETKPIEAFSRSRDRTSGRRSQCKECVKEYAAKWRAQNSQYNQTYYAENRDWFLAYYKRRYAQNPDLKKQQNAKRRALLRGVEHQPWTRTEIYNRDQGTCRSCGAQLENAARAFNIDHIVPIALGGPDIPANLQLMCPPCNQSKSAQLEGQIHLGL